MLAGQLGCEALNFVLKRIIKEERPKGMFKLLFETCSPRTDTNLLNLQKCSEKATECLPLTPSL